MTALRISPRLILFAAAGEFAEMFKFAGIGLADFITTTHSSPKPHTNKFIDLNKII